MTLPRALDDPESAVASRSIRRPIQSDLGQHQVQCQVGELLAGVNAALAHLTTGSNYSGPNAGGEERLKLCSKSAQISPTEQTLGPFSETEVKGSLESRSLDL